MYMYICLYKYIYICMHTYIYPHGPFPIKFPSEEGSDQKGSGNLPESQGQNLALTVLYVTDLIDSGTLSTGRTPSSIYPVL